MKSFLLSTTFFYYRGCYILQCEGAMNFGARTSRLVVDPEFAECTCTVHRRPRVMGSVCACALRMQGRVQAYITPVLRVTGYCSACERLCS